MTNLETETLQNEPAPQKSRRGFWIILFVLVILIAGGVGGLFVIQSQEETAIADGRTAIGNGDWTSAVSAFDRALDVQPAFLRQQSSLAQGLRGLARYQQGSLDQALADLDAALAADGEMFDLLAYRSDLHYQQGNFTAALADSATVLAQADLLPEHLLARLHANQSLILESQGDVAGAQTEAAATLMYYPYLVDEQINRLQAIQARAAFAVGDWENAVPASRAALEIADELSAAALAELYAGQAAVFYERADLNAALAVSDEALARQDQLDEAAQLALYQMRAQIAWTQGDMETAIAEAEAAAALDESLPLPYAYRAWQAYLAFDEATALEAAAAALDLDSDNALAYRVQGLVTAWQGHAPEAIADLQKALELDPQDVEAAAMLAYLAYDLNDEELMEIAVSQAVSADPNAPATLWAQTQQLTLNYDWKEAQPLIDAAIALDSSRPEYYVSRFWIYHTTKERQTEGLTDLEAALALDPQWAPALIAKATVLQNQFMADEAKELIDQAIVTQPDWFRAHIQLGY